MLKGRHAIAVLAACAATACAPAPRVATAPGRCGRCAMGTTNADVADGIDARVADLKVRGGDCVTYGQVLERSLVAGRISVRPFMWRVGRDLASAQATPAGEIAVAREIDSLNVGRRTLDDVLWSVEHEAVHIAFQIPSGEPADDAVVERVVRACRPADMATTRR